MLTPSERQDIIDNHRLRVTTVLPSYTGEQGEQLVYNDGTNYWLYSWIDGAWRSQRFGVTPSSIVTGNLTGISISGTGTSFTTDAGTSLSLTATEGQKAIMMFGGSWNVTKNGQARTLQVKFNIDSGTHIVTGLQTQWNSAGPASDTTEEDASCIAFKDDLSAGSHTFTMRLTGSSSSSFTGYLNDYGGLTVILI